MASLGDVFDRLFGWLFPKPPKQKPPSLEDFSVPTAQDGRELGALYGTCWFEDPNVTWYDDLQVRTQTKDGVKMRRWYMGLHFEVGQSWDRLLEIRADGSDGKIVWQGDVDDSTGYLDLTADKLFGGRDSGGGIAGRLDILWGRDDQVANDYLESVLGMDMPAFRGRQGFVFRQGLVGANTPSIAPWAFRGRRIFTDWETPDGECWYAEKAEIGAITTTQLSYDAYCQGESGGPTLDYWWKMSGNYTATGVSEPNYGAAGAMPLYARESVTTLTSQVDTIVEGTEDGFAVRKGHMFNSHTANVLVYGDLEFTVGGWFNITGIEDAVGVFKSNAGNSGYRCGIHIRLEVNRVIVTASRGSSGSNKIWRSPIGSFSYNTIRFIVLIVTPAPNTSDLGLRLYIDGAEVELDGVGDNHLIDWNTSVGSEEKGISFSRTDGQSNGSAYGTYDELFFHFGELTDAQIAEMDRRGRGAFEVETRGDMNPAHILYEARTNTKRGLGYPVAKIDDANFRAAADVFYDEVMGLSLRWTRRDEVGEFIRIIERHADCFSSVSQRTGLFRCKPIRDDYDPGTLDSWGPADIVRVEDYTSIGYGDVVGRVTVRYTHPETGRECTTAPIDNAATIAAQGRVVAEVIDYPGIRQHDLAMRVCMREARKRTNPLKGFTVVLNRRDWAVERGDVRKVYWPQLGLAGVIVRVIGVNYGSFQSRTMKVDVIEDIYGLPDSAYIVHTDSVWEEPDDTPVPPEVRTAIEMPYLMLREALGDAETASLPGDAGYSDALAVQPLPLSDGYDLWQRIFPAPFAERALWHDWMPTALLDGALAQSATSIPVTSSTLDDADVGDLIQIGGGRAAEIVRVTGGDLTSTVTVDRGVLDTTPRTWDSGTRLWALPPLGALRDTARYADGDEVDYRQLTRTSSGILPVGSGITVSVMMDSRQARPYPPGDMQVNGESWPLSVSGAITVTWAHRDRITQGTTVVTQDESDIGPEAGSTYNVYAYDDSDDSVIDSDTGLSGTSWMPTIGISGVVRIEVESERDGYVSWQRQVRTFVYGVSAPLLDTDGDYLLDTYSNPIHEA